MTTTFSSGAEFLRKARLTVLTDALFYAEAMVAACPDRLVGAFATNHGRHVSTAFWDHDELLANIHLPLGSPSPKARVVLFASRDRLTDDRIEDIMWRWLTLRRNAGGQGVRALDWFVFDGDGEVESMARLTGIDTWGLADERAERAETA